MPAPRLVTPLLAALNPLLASQPAARARLAGHAGKTLRIILPVAPLDLSLDEEGGFIAAPEGAVADLTLTPDPTALPRWLTGGTLNDLFRVDGDGALGSDLGAALAGFDWVLALRPWLGDIAASRVDQFLRGFGQWGRGAAESAGRNLAEYAVHEQALLADPLAIHDFIAEVDALREAADRLEARLKLLETRKPG